MKTNRIDHLRIASPCPVGWEQMTGDNRVRFCDLCKLNVYNIARLTRKETEALIAETEGRICARLYHRSDGTIITRDCPVGLRAIRRRAAKIAGTVFTAIVSLGSALGQKPSSKKDKASCQQQVTISRKVTEAQVSEIAGTILDPNGVVVPGAKIAISNQKVSDKRVVESDSEGRFQLSGLTAGSYDIGVTCLGFKKFDLKNVKLENKEALNLDCILLLDETTVTVGIIIDTPLIDTSTLGTTIISGEMIRRLPIPRE